MAVVQVIPEGDLALENGNFVFIEGSRMVRQVIISRFRMFLGDWFLDLREGVPYYRDVLVKNPDRAVVRSVFEQVLTGTPGVLSVIRFEIVYDSVERTIAFDFEAMTTDGVITVAPDDDAFVVRL